MRVGATPRPHLRDSRRAQVEVQRHRVRPQHLLPQILQPGVDGGVGPAESRYTPLWRPCSQLGPQEGTPTPQPTHPSSCWSSPRHTGRRALPPSCSSRRCSFLATKLNLQRRQSWCGGTRPVGCTGWGLPRPRRLLCWLPEGQKGLSPAPWVCPAVGTDVYVLQ